MSKPLPRGARLVGLFLVRGGQLTAPLGPTPLEDKATAFRFHTGAKAEFSSSTNLARLVSTLHVPGSFGSMRGGERLLACNKLGVSSIDSMDMSRQYNNSPLVRQ